MIHSGAPLPNCVSMLAILVNNTYILRARSRRPVPNPIAASPLAPVAVSSVAPGPTRRPAG